MKKTSKVVRLIHNPDAGEGQQQSYKAVISSIESNGYSCVYSSAGKKALKAIAPETEFIAIAGGDGTIRKTIIQLLDKKLKYIRPIALFPFGTANNLASALFIPQDFSEYIASWSAYHLKKFDVGQLLGFPKPGYFIESCGFGLFPKLMAILHTMDKSHIQTPDDEFDLALNELLKLNKTYKAVPMTIEINEEKIEEECLLTEVMNISSIGPHLNLAPAADPGDGYFDVIIVKASDRHIMEKYLEAKCAKKDVVFPIVPIRAKRLVISWQGEDAHMDDEIIEGKNFKSLQLSVLGSSIEMVV